MDSAYKSYVQELLVGDIRFVVPPFQRRYVWTGAEWRRLWDDIQNTATDPAGAHHFLGPVVFLRNNGTNAAQRVLGVVDGQQRLITVQLLAAAFRDVAAARGLHQIAQRAAAFTIDEATDRAAQSRLTPALADRVDFRATMSAGSVKGVQTIYPSGGLPPIAQAYRFYAQRIAVVADAAGKRARDVLTKLLDALGRAVYLVVMELGERDDPQAIYERLNSGGAILRPSDLIRNHVLHQCERQGLSQLDMYDRYWADFDDGLWLAGPSPQSPNRLDRLLRMYLIMEDRADVPPTNLFARFRTYIARHQGRLAETLARIARYGQVFDRLDTGEGLEPYETEFLERLRVIDSTVFTPVLLYLFGEYDAERRRPALGVLESFLLRRHACGLSPASHGGLVPHLLRALTPDAEPGPALRDHLAAVTGKDRWPRDAEVLELAPRRSIYADRRTKPAQMLLLLAERQLAGPDARVPVVSDDLTVEHLLPQGWRAEGWPIDERDSRQVSQEQRDRDSLVHTIGNLTVVPGALNRELADRPWAEKARLLVTSPFRLNQEAPANFGTAASIRARGESIAGLLCAALVAPPVIAVPEQRRPARSRRKAAAAVRQEADPSPVNVDDELAVDTEALPESELPVGGDGDVGEVREDDEVADIAKRRRGYNAQIRDAIREAGGALTYLEIAAAAAIAHANAVPAKTVKYLLDTWAVPGVQPTTKDGLRAGVLKPNRRPARPEPDEA